MTCTFTPVCIMVNNKHSTSKLLLDLRPLENSGQELCVDIVNFTVGRIYTLQLIHSIALHIVL